METNSLKVTPKVINITGHFGLEEGTTYVLMYTYEDSIVFVSESAAFNNNGMRIPEGGLRITPKAGKVFWAWTENASNKITVSEE